MVRQLAPGLRAAEIGLSRTRREAGDLKGAEIAFLRALEGLARDIRGFREGGTLPAGAEEVALTLLETAADPPEPRKGAVPLDEELISWAPASQPFAADPHPDDWATFC